MGRLKREQMDGFDRAIVWTLRVSGPTGVALVAAGVAAGVPALAGLGAYFFVLFLALGLGWLVYSS